MFRERAIRCSGLTLVALLLAGCPQPLNELGQAGSTSERGTRIVPGVYIGEATGTVTCGARGLYSSDDFALGTSFELTPDGRVFLDGSEAAQGVLWFMPSHDSVVLNVSFSSTRILISAQDTYHTGALGHTTLTYEYIDDDWLRLTHHQTWNLEGVSCEGGLSGLLSR